MRWLLLFAFCALSACAGQSDPPLTVIRASAPVFDLQPDHLDYGTLPRITQ